MLLKTLNFNHKYEYSFFLRLKELGPGKGGAVKDEKPNLAVYNSADNPRIDNRSAITLAKENGSLARAGDGGKITTIDTVAVAGDPDENDDIQVDSASEIQTGSLDNNTEDFEDQLKQAAASFEQTESSLEHLQAELMALREQLSREIDESRDIPKNETNKQETRNEASEVAKEGFFKSIARKASEFVGNVVNAKDEIKLRKALGVVLLTVGVVATVAYAAPLAYILTQALGANALGTYAALGNIGNLGTLGAVGLQGAGGAASGLAAAGAYAGAKITKWGAELLGGKPKNKKLEALKNAHLDSEKHDEKIDEQPQPKAESRELAGKSEDITNMEDGTIITANISFVNNGIPQDREINLVVWTDPNGLRQVEIQGSNPTYVGFLHEISAENISTLNHIQEGNRHVIENSTLTPASVEFTINNFNVTPPQKEQSLLTVSDEESTTNSIATNGDVYMDENESKSSSLAISGKEQSQTSIETTSDAKQLKSANTDEADTKNGQEAIRNEMEIDGAPGSKSLKLVAKDGTLILFPVTYSNEDQFKRAIAALNSVWDGGFNPTFIKNTDGQYTVIQQFPTSDGTSQGIVGEVTPNQKNSISAGVDENQSTTETEIKALNPASETTEKSVESDTNETIENIPRSKFETQNGMIKMKDIQENINKTVDMWNGLLENDAELGGTKSKAVNNALSNINTGKTKEQQITLDRYKEINAAARAYKDMPESMKSMIESMEETTEFKSQKLDIREETEGVPAINEKTVKDFNLGLKVKLILEKFQKTSSDAIDQGKKWFAGRQMLSDKVEKNEILFSVGQDFMDKMQTPSEVWDYVFNQINIQSQEAGSSNVLNPETIAQLKTGNMSVLTSLPDEQQLQFGKLVLEILGGDEPEEALKEDKKPE